MKCRCLKFGRRRDEEEASEEWMMTMPVYARLSPRYWRRTWPWYGPSRAVRVARRKTDFRTASTLRAGATRDLGCRFHQTARASTLSMLGVVIAHIHWLTNETKVIKSSAKVSCSYAKPVRHRGTKCSVSAACLSQFKRCKISVLGQFIFPKQGCGPDDSEVLAGRA